MVPNVFAQSIVDEKDCKIIGEELDSNIECRYLLKTPEGLSIDLELDQGSARYYDQEKNILYLGERWNEVYDEDGNRIEVTLNAWKHNYVGVELDTLTIVDQLHCEPIITGTYEKIVTYPCELELEIESKDHKLVLPSKRDWIDHPNAFVQYEENVIFAETYYAKGDRSYAIALFDYNGNKIRWLHDEPSHAKAFGEPNRANIDALIVSQTKTTTPYIYYVIYGDGKSHSKTGGLHVMQGEKPFSILHSYNTDLKFGGKIFLNEDKNQVYYLVGDVMYKIKGMGHLKPTGIASFVDQTKDPQYYIDRYNNESTYKEWFDENYPQYSSIYEAVGLDEPVAEQINEPEYVPEPVFAPEPVMEQEVNCGPGTESVNGICEIIQTEEGGGCLIATATYGSELAPQVQQLRELRDNQLLQTESGSAFMGTFNDIYYSFSPTIADMEREHPMFKEAVKLAITPMISTLSLMENANSESEVLSIGISVIVLNLGMYLGVPAIVVVGIRKKF